MLVLTRKREERILIGGGISVKIVEIKADKVTLGIEAPIEVPVHREEVAKRIAAEPS